MTWLHFSVSVPVVNCAPCGNTSDEGLVFMYWFAARGFWHVLEHLLDDFVDLRLWHRLFRRGEITLCLSFAKEKNGDVRDGSVVGTHAFRRLGFDTNRVGLNVQQAGDSALDLGRVWTNPGLGQDERGIYVS